ncbi:unnamed protein product [Ranitomeya imitator]|uniref:Uncharacterized protein n=1 Tax=Ranitomeya imitator TaxID=111125 RepID=A0ABN9M147_9NEOB|nr:unnamed protein product [Ranitomeya imitator]
MKISVRKGRKQDGIEEILCSSTLPLLFDLPIAFSVVSCSMPRLKTKKVAHLHGEKLQYLHKPHIFIESHFTPLWHAKDKLVQVYNILYDAMIDKLTKREVEAKFCNLSLSVNNVSTVHPVSIPLQVPSHAIS